jgi:hypothetical protein
MFVPVTNNVMLTGVKGRFIELRLAMTRDNTNKDPSLDDLTLHGLGSAFNDDAFLDDTSAYETQDATFSPYVIGPEPLTYQWFAQYPWMNGWEWTLLAGGTHTELVISNVDSFIDWTQVGVLVTDAAEETLWLGPAELQVVPWPIVIPGSGSSGPASRYPATINVFGQPTNLASVAVTLWDLSHTRSADLGILLVSPTGTNIMLMSRAGGTNGVSQADVVFEAGWSPPSQFNAIPSETKSKYSPCNYEPINQIPQVGTNPPPAGPYTINLDRLVGTDPNGIWKLYIYDDRQGGAGHLSGSWQLDFTFQ